MDFRTSLAGIFDFVRNNRGRNHCCQQPLVIETNISITFNVEEDDEPCYNDKMELPNLFNPVRFLRR